MVSYRLRVDLTYSTTGTATTATTNINNALAASSDPVIAERAERTGSAVSLTVEGLTEAQADSLRVAMTSAWAVGTRSAGKVSVVRTGI